MTQRSSNFPKQYKDTLRKYLKAGAKADISCADGLGAIALAAGFKTLDLSKLHEKTLVMDILPGYPEQDRDSRIMQAAIFFAAAITDSASGTPAQGTARLTQAIESLSDRTVQLATANQLLRMEVTHRKKIEKSLFNAEKKHVASLEKSDQLREQLRNLSRRMIKNQEDERRKISRELHDVIAQELTGINIQLTTLKIAAGIKAKGLNRDIAITQRRVMRSAKIIHKFARNLRPTALDDLGLTVTLKTLLKNFSQRTHIGTSLTTYAGVDDLNSEKRTVLYRVAQESLCNIARHSNASHAKLRIRRDGHYVRLDVSDNGQSFDIEAKLSSRGNKHLGLLGMRERVEMTGGRFEIEAIIGTGTTITARIPVSKAMAKQWKSDSIRAKKSKS